MKRIIALLLVMVMLTATPVMANTHTTGAQLLKQYNIIAGSDGDLMTEAPFTRAMACAILAELYGKQKEALATPYTKTFNDIEAKHWYAPYVLYAQSQGWVKGYPDGSFKATNPISQQEWAALLMTALEYPFTWSTVVDDLLTIGVEIPASKKDALLRGEAFEALWVAVNTPRASQRIALGVEIGKLPQAQQPPKALDLTVEKIQSLKQIALISSEPLDVASVTDTKNYAVSAVGIPGLSVKQVTYDTSASRILITLSEAVPQQTDITLTLSGLKAVSGTALENGKKFIVNMLDATPPSVVSAQVIGTHTIKVVFSEPVVATNSRLSNNDFIINNGSIIIKEVTLQNQDTVAYIETFQELKEPVRLMPKETIRDFFNFSLQGVEMVLSVQKETTPPMVIGYEDLSPTGVTLIWNKDIRVANGQSTFFYHTQSTFRVDTNVNATHINGNKLRLHFTTHIISPGNTQVLVSSGAVMDYWGNRNNTVTQAISLPEDRTNPTVLGGVTPISERRIRIQFSEPIFNRNGEAQSRSHVKLLKEDGTDVSQKIAALSYANATNTLEIQFIEDLSGNFVLELNQFTDYSKNPLENKQYPFEMKDLTPPNPDKWTARLYNPGLHNQMIKIRFDEPMAVTGKYSILDPALYFVNGKALDALDQSLLRIVAVDNQSSVEIYYPGAVMTGGVTFFADLNQTKNAADDIQIGRVADVNGNYTQALSSIIDLEGKGSLTIESATHVGEDAVEVIISDRLISVSPSDFRIESAGKLYPVAGYDFDFLSSQKTKLTLKLTEPLLGNPSGMTLKAVGQGSVNQYGEALDLGAAAITLKDGMPPVVATANFDGSRVPYVVYNRTSGIITIRFSETIDSRTVSLLSFDVPGYTVADISVNGTDIRITIDPKDRQLVSLYDLVTQKVEIRDLAGNGTVGINLQIQRVE